MLALGAVRRRRSWGRRVASAAGASLPPRPIRRHLRALVRRSFPDVTVLSHAEIVPELTLRARWAIALGAGGGGGARMIEVFVLLLAQWLADLLPAGAPESSGWRRSRRD
jgi:hypothetical protein